MFPVSIVYVDDLMERIKYKKEMLHRLVGGRIERLQEEDVYRVSCEVDELIVELMRVQLNQD